MLRRAFSLSNVDFKMMARGAGVSNLFTICTGWVATYEVWTLYPQAAQAARVELSIDETVMLLPIHTYLSHHSSTEIDVHLNIAPDVASFIIGETLCTLRQTDTGALCLSCPLPVRSSQGLSFEWSASEGDKRPAIHTSCFSPDSQTLGLLEWMPSGAQHLSVFELIKDLPTLKLNPLGALEFVPGINRIEEVIFHPHQCILAFCVYDKLNHKNTAYLRRYRHCMSIYPNICNHCANAFTASSAQPGFSTELPKSTLWDSVGFSSCGQFFVVRCRLRKTTEVIPIPHSLQDANDVTLPVTQSTSQRQSIIANEGPTAQLSHSRASHLFGSGAVTSRTDFCPQEGTVELSVDASANEVQMSLTNPSGSRQTARLVSLPTWIGAEHTTQRIVLPRFADDTLKISVDVDPRASYKHSEYSLGRSSFVPAVIERDMSYVELGPITGSSNSLSRLLQNSATESHTGQKRSYSQARLQEDETGRYALQTRQTTFTPVPRQQ